MGTDVVVAEEPKPKTVKGIKLRCSELPRFLACPSCKLPWEHPVKDDSEPARIGREVHEAMASVMHGPRPEGLEREVEILTRTLAKMFEDITPQLWPNGTDLVDLEVEPHYRYEGDGWILSGHIDVNCLDIMAFIDWKTGWLDHDYQAQMAGYALILNLPFVRGFVLWARTRTVDQFVFCQTPAIRAGVLAGLPNADPAYIIVLDKFQERITKAVKRIGKAYRPGPHCFGCPGVHECVAYRNYLQTYVGALVPMSANLPMEREQIAAAWHTWKQLEQIGRGLKDLVRNTLRQDGPLPAGNGFSWQLVERRQESIDVPAAWEQLSAVLGDRLPACLTAAKGTVEKAVKDTLPRGEKTKGWMSLMESLRQEGALTEQMVERIECRKEE